MDGFFPFSKSFCWTSRPSTLWLLKLWTCLDPVLAEVSLLVGISYGKADCFFQFHRLLPLPTALLMVGDKRKYTEWCGGRSTPWVVDTLTHLRRQSQCHGKSTPKAFSKKKNSTSPSSWAAEKKTAWTGGWRCRWAWSEDFCTILPCAADWPWLLTIKNRLKTSQADP